MGPGMGNGDVRMGEGMSGDDGAWVTVAEAARRLRVTPRAIRGRLDRGTIPWKPEGNDGRLVWVPSRDVPVPHPGTSPSPIPGTASLHPRDSILLEPAPAPAADGALVAELRARLQALEVEREAMIEAGDRLVDELGEARERAARAEGRAETLERALADLAGRLDRTEALLARPWWRRLLG